MHQPTLPLRLVRRSSSTLAVQLATQVRDLVSTGTLRPGERLPSNRALAADLGVARAVVEQAYDQLLAEGWLTTRRGAGTYVADVGRLPAVAPSATDGVGTVAAHDAGLVSMDTGTPWVDPRHEAGWRRAWREVSVARMPRGYPDPAGVPELRRELAAYVSRARGISCRPEEVVVTAGTTHGLALVLDALGHEKRGHEKRGHETRGHDTPGGAVAVEDPGYRAAVAAAGQAGWGVVDVPVDAEGLDVGALRAQPGRIQAIYATPAHQHPLGITMSAGRRIALLAEATRRGALVLEDDYDSEFRYDVAPLPALASLDRARVVYLGTASKSVHPALRIGWLVGSEALVAEIAHRRAARHDHPAWPVQRAFLAMLQQGHVDRLVRSARRVYAERSRAVADALTPFGTISSPPAGMYLTVGLSAEVADAVRADCRRAGFEVPSLADYSRSSDRTGLVVGFGGLTDHELAGALGALTAALRRNT